MAAPFGGLAPGQAQALHVALHDVPRQIEHVFHSTRIDALEQHAGRGVIAVGDHHRADHEGRDADHAGHALHLLHQLPVFAEVAGVLEDQHVRVDAQHLLAELRAKAAGHADDGRQRADTERDAQAPRTSFQPKRTRASSIACSGAQVRAEIPSGPPFSRQGPSKTPEASTRETRTWQRCTTAQPLRQRARPTQALAAPGSRRAPRIRLNSADTAETAGRCPTRWPGCGTGRVSSGGLRIARIAVSFARIELLSSVASAGAVSRLPGRVKPLP